MKVAYLVNQYPKVSHTFIRREILALEKLGHGIDRYALRGWNEATPDEGDAKEKRLTKYVLGQGGGSLLKAGLLVALTRLSSAMLALKFALSLGNGAARSRWYFVIYWFEAAWLLRQLRRDPVDHLHAHFGTNAAAVAAICRVMGGPSFSFTVHGPEEFDHPVGLHLKKKASVASGVFAVSSFGKSQLMRWIDSADWHKIAIVRCGLDEALLDCAIEPLTTAPTFVCVGRLCEQKGQLLLVNAFSRVMKLRPDAHLVLAGDGEMRAEVEARIRELGLESAIRITGWINGHEVVRLLRASRAMVLPSFAEGLPVVIMEAMAVGTPVISTYVAGIPELVVQEETGELVPAGDEQALANSLIRFLSRETELDTYRRNAKIKVQERHRAFTIARQLAEAFARCAVDKK